MSQIDDGGSAFPNPEMGQSHFADVCAYPGMSLRDYFAAQAMPVILEQVLLASHYVEMPAGKPIDGHEVAVDAYAVADAMLAARKERIGG